MAQQDIISRSTMRGIEVATFPLRVLATLKKMLDGAVILVALVVVVGIFWPKTTKYFPTDDVKDKAFE